MASPLLLLPLLGASGDGPVGGELTLRLADGTAMTVSPASCVESASERGSGVELRDEHGAALRFQHDSLTGPALRVFTPEGEPAAELVPRDCQLFHGELRQRTEADGPLVEVTYGHLDLECERADGMTVSGSLDFDHCLAR